MINELQFMREVEAAGLNGLPFGWNADGVVVNDPNLTQEQRDAVLALAAAHDPNATITEFSVFDPVLKVWAEDTAAKDAATAEAAREATYTEQSDRQVFIDHLNNSSAAEIETFVRGRIDADSVTDVASATAAIKRIETALVRLLQLFGPR